MTNPTDHDLTVMVDRAARDLTESRAAYIPGSPKWDELSDGDKNLIREQALPFIFHGTKALSELGYRKPHTASTVDELYALSVGCVVIDRDGDAWQLNRSGWTCTDRALNTVDQPSASLISILGPVVVIWEP